MSYNAEEYIQSLKERIEQKKKLLESGTKVLPRILEEGYAYAYMERTDLLGKIAAKMFSLQVLLQTVESETEDAKMALHLISRASTEPYLRPEDANEAVDYILLNMVES